MNTLDAIYARRSTRNYTDQPVEKEKLETIVRAGNQAAIAGKLDFVVITRKSVLDLIQNTSKEVMLNSGNDFLTKRANTPGFEVLYNAPAAIAVITDTANDPQTAAMNTANAACAAENILLAATELGIASCYTVSSTLGFAVPAVNQAAGIAENKTVACIIALGYSHDTPSPVKRNTDNITWCE